MLNEISEFDLPKESSDVREEEKNGFCRKITSIRNVEVAKKEETYSSKNIKKSSKKRDVKQIKHTLSSVLKDEEINSEAKTRMSQKINMNSYISEISTNDTHKNSAHSESKMEGDISKLDSIVSEDFAIDKSNTQEKMNKKALETLKLKKKLELKLKQVKDPLNDQKVQQISNFEINLDETKVSKKLDEGDLRAIYMRRMTKILTTYEGYSQPKTRRRKSKGNKMYQEAIDYLKQIFSL